MEMKWNPIVNGDLSGIPRDVRLLVTRIDGDKPYVDIGYLESILEKHAVIEVGDIGIQVKAEECVAWMKLPEPYNPKANEINEIKVFLTDDEQNEVLKAMRETGKFVSGVNY